MSAELHGRARVKMEVSTPARAEKHRVRVASGKTWDVNGKTSIPNNIELIRAWIAAGCRVSSGRFMNLALSRGSPKMITLFSQFTRWVPCDYARAVNSWNPSVNVRLLGALEQADTRLTGVLHTVAGLGRCVTWRPAGAAVEQVRDLLRMGHDPTELHGGENAIDLLREHLAESGEDGGDGAVAKKVLELLRENAIARGRECIPDDLGLCEAALRDVLEFMF